MLDSDMCSELTQACGDAPVLQLQLWLVVLQTLAVQHVPPDLLQLVHQLLRCCRLHMLAMQCVSCCCYVCCWVLVDCAP